MPCLETGGRLKPQLLGSSADWRYGELVELGGLTTMRILLCHNYYRERGGEDESFDAEVRLLQDAGHQVVTYTKHSDMAVLNRPWRIAREAAWSGSSYGEIDALIQKHSPDIVHCTNLLPLISPSVCHAAHRNGVPVVKALRNYTLICPSGQLLRGGQVCEDCLHKKIPWPSVLHGCYRRSRAASAVMAGAATMHDWKGTWTNQVSQFFTLTEFARSRFVKAGLPATRIAVKPNFLNRDPGPGEGQSEEVLFVGRLSSEKGISVLARTWLEHPDLPPLRIVGDGPLAHMIADLAARDARITWTGQLSLSEVLCLLGDSRLLIMPSVWYETFGRTIMEAFARGTPVVASNLGAMKELVTHRRTGLLFEPGDAAALAARVREALQDPGRLQAMRQCARTEFLEKYTAERNLEMLLQLYENARSEIESSTRPA